MKFLAKSPSGPAYELSRDELEDPTTCARLGIDDTWMVKVGETWISVAEFRNPRTRVKAEDTSAKSSAHSLPSRAEDWVAATASWTPAAVFGLFLRLVGLYLLLQCFISVVTLVSGQLNSRPMNVDLNNQFLTRALLVAACYGAMGLYLVKGARAFVGWVFGDRAQVKAAEVENSPSAVN